MGGLTTTGFTTTGLAAAGLTTTGLAATGFTATGLAAAGLWAGVGLAGGAGGAITAGLLTTAGAAGVATAGDVGAATEAFLRVRILLAGASALLLGDGGWFLSPFPAPPPFTPLAPRSERIFAASLSLMELLWLFAAIDSFSAASSTSRFSRPRSRDSS